MISATRAIDVINSLYGRHPGCRALHARGLVCRARFTATPEVAELTRAAHMQGRTVDALVRFSNGSGDPSSPDHAPDLRGMAATFLLSHEARTDIVAETASRFPSDTPEGFLEFLRAVAPGPGRVIRLATYLVRHPRALGILPPLQTAIRPPVSYATCRYFGINAFRWTSACGAVHHVRYTWIPEAGVASLSGREARRQAFDYLQRELLGRLARGPVRFMLELQLAGHGDEVDDPSTPWPATRETVHAGTLEIVAPEAVGGADDPRPFDPMRLTDGIEASEDPILHFRHRAYAVSVERRAGADEDVSPGSPERLPAGTAHGAGGPGSG
jgi:catalase